MHMKAKLCSAKMMTILQTLGADMVRLDEEEKKEKPAQEPQSAPVQHYIKRAPC